MKENIFLTKEYEYLESVLLEMIIELLPKVDDKTRTEVVHKLGNFLPKERKEIEYEKTNN